MLTWLFIRVDFLFLCLDVSRETYVRKEKALEKEGPDGRTRKERHPWTVTKNFGVPPIIYTVFIISHLVLQATPTNVHLSKIGRAHV